MSTQNADQPLKQVADLVHEATDFNPLMAIRAVAKGILNALASLRLTVVLLVLAVLVIWIVTLEQTRYDIWTVKQKHFPSLFVFIPFQTFFPPAWFPTMQTVPGGFFMPSGTLILVVMIINLIAAHAMRMRVQAKSGRLWLGLLTTLIGAGVTWGVIFYGQNPDGFQGSPPVTYQYMWTLIQVGMLGLVVLAIGSIFGLKKTRVIEKVLLGLFSLVMAAVLGFVVYLGQDAFIGDSAMRILWQLIQSTIAALILLAGCILVFKRKGGVVLIHMGIGLLMVNELYVTMTNVEQRMTVVEGETVSHTVDIRSTELMVMKKTDDGKHDLVMIPRGELIKDQVISRDDLPFDIECIEYHPNAELIRTNGTMNNLANRGIGTVYISRELPVVSGLSQDEMDVASAYVRVIDKKTNEDIGVYLASQISTLNNAYDEIEVDGTTYYVGLRFRHYYKPYSITLKDVVREDYVGTETPRTYSSEFVLDDHEKEVSSDQRIWMNNPLRYGNETFYQSGHDTNKEGRELTVMQIVKNAGWMIPYVACMIVVVGLVAQFGSTLLKFLEKAQDHAFGDGGSQPYSAKVVGDELKVPLDQVADASHRKGSFGKWAAIAVVVVLGLYVGGKAMRATRAKVVNNEMRLDRLGEMPLTYGGRVQPMDSLARNTLRQLSNREEVVYPGAKKKLFGLSVEKQPAVRWLADLIFKADGYDKVQLVRIEDPSVQNALGLPKSRKGLKYTLSELDRARPEIDRLAKEAIALKKAKQPVSALQNRVLEVYNKLETVYGLSLSLSAVPAQEGPDPFARLHLARQLTTATAPRNVFVKDEGWLAIPIVEQRKFIQELAKEKDCKNISEVAQHLVREYLVKPELANMIKDVLITEFLADQEMVDEVKAQQGLANNEQLIRFLEQRMTEQPKEFGELPRSIQEAVDERMQADVLPKTPMWETNVYKMLLTINNQEEAIMEIDASLLTPFMEMEQAYRAGEAEKFNAAVESHLASVAETPPTEFSSSRMFSEKFYNGFSPFYWATALYFFACVVTLIGWAGVRQMKWAAFSLIALALVIQVIGIVLRVQISGRPPVTNLYSSFVVVSAAAVGIMMIVELVTRIGIGNMLAGICGTALMLWAWTISIRDGDTFTVLLAVLDTQFWLSTHVMCISLGYSATVVAGLLGIAFLIASLTSKHFDKAKRKTFGNLIYGTVCLALLLSFFGTVLGGLWGDDSWGRFWGWDPKENGALMIVFWNAVLLHARWAGLVRERGMAALAIIGNVVTIWSWEGVNQLGVGLHSYGVSEGKLQSIMLVALLHVGLAALAFIPVKAWASNRGASRLKDA
jgi:ABC-type transport system involved in cytochrome c biogenesis permease subunit/DNA polymerase III delta prime subunit